MKPRPLVVSVCGLKGGIGKSTVSLNLASAWFREGKSVCVIDSDPQGSCRQFAALAAEREQPGPPVMALDAKTFSRDFARLTGGFDYVVIDTPPRLGPECRAAMLVATVVLLPLLPSVPDVWALQDTIDLVREAQQLLRPDLLAAVVMNRMGKTNLARESRAALTDMDVHVLDAKLSNRVAFGDAWARGLGVVQHDPSGEASTEMRRVAREVLALARSPQNETERAGVCA